MAASTRTKAAGALTGAEFVSRISPMKRILCLCPVLSPRSSCDEALASEGYERYAIGMAVSDPYLGFSTPITSNIDATSHEPASSTDGLYVYKGIGVTNKRKHPTYWKGMVRTRQEFLLQIGGYQDIGGIAFALPMRTEQRTELSDMKIHNARDTLRHVLNHFRSVGSETNDSSPNSSRYDQGHIKLGRNEFDLQCNIKERLTMLEALRMKREEPEMWEEIDLDTEKRSLLPSSVHAAAALNSFLWQTTGGWRNTFA